MADVPVPVTLAEIREIIAKRDEALAWVARASADDGELDAAARAFEAAQDKLAARVPVLADALEAAMRWHEPVVRRTNWKPTCKYCGRKWPCPEIQAVTAALKGKEG